MPSYNVVADNRETLAIPCGHTSDERSSKTDWRHRHPPTKRQLRYYTARLKQMPAHAVPGFSLGQRFNDLADRWQRETGHMSVTIKRVMHPAYQDIMAMGPRVVPLLLRDLLRTRRDWFWALQHLTQYDAIAASGARTKDDMIAAWEAWGRNRGMI